MEPIVDVLAQAMIREYLHRNQYLKTLETFDKECPRQPNSISSRTVMIELMNLHKIVYNCQKKYNQMYSFLEMIADYFKNKKKSTMKKKKNVTKKMEKKEEITKIERKKIERKEERRKIEKKKEKFIQPSSKPIQSSSKPTQSSPKHEMMITGTNIYKKNDLILEDVDVGDDTLEIKSTKMIQYTLIGHEFSNEIKKLLFGHSKGLFLSAWYKQGFYFNKNIKYGIVQREGGTCGIIASVQAYVLKYFYERNNFDNITFNDQMNALKHSLSTILYNIGGENCILVKGSSIKNIEKNIQNFQMYKCKSKEEIFEFFSNHLNLYTKEDGIGVILFLLSAILSRGIHNIRLDFDREDSSLIAEHGYCSQEIVNLLLTGKATSNVFDNTKKIGQDENFQILKGISNQPCIGFLSEHERKGYEMVGNYYKCPKYPIWVILSESHYSVLFSKQSQSQELYYYDPLGNQDDEILLKLVQGGIMKDESPIERVILTKWPNVSIEWINCERLL